MDDDKLEHIEKQLAEIKKAESPLNKYILQIITIVFLAGGGWMTLDGVQALAEDNAEKIEHEEKQLVEQDKKLIRIETRQEQMKEKLEEQDDKLDKIIEKLEELD